MSRNPTGKLYADDVIGTLEDVKKFQRSLTVRLRKTGCCGGTVEESQTAPPFVLHCSAGIGRTGTFLAIDHGIEHLQSKSREVRSCA